MASRRNGNTIVAVLEAKKENPLGVPADFPTSKEPGWKS
jgi:hypothetical protein